jgi:hypothetical protein
MGELTVLRRCKYGHDRACVQSEAGERLGFGCQKTWLSVEDESLRQQVGEAVARFRAENGLDEAGPIEPTAPAVEISASPSVGSAVGSLTVNRWTKRGFDRAYVQNTDDCRSGSVA